MNSLFLIFISAVVLACLSRARSQSSQLARPEQVSCDWWRTGHVTSCPPLIGQSSQVDRPETRGHNGDLSLNLITNPELLETRSSSSHGPGIGSSIMILML